MQCIWRVGLVSAVGSHSESAIVVVLIYGLPRAALHMSVSNTVQHVAVAYILFNWLILKGVWDTDGMKCINCAALPIHDFKSCTYVRTYH